MGRAKRFDVFIKINRVSGFAPLPANFGLLSFSTHGWHQGNAIGLQQSFDLIGRSKHAVHEFSPGRKHKAEAQADDRRKRQHQLAFWVALAQRPGRSQ